MEPRYDEEVQPEQHAAHRADPHAKAVATARQQAVPGAAPATLVIAAGEGVSELVFDTKEPAQWGEGGSLVEKLDQQLA